MRGMFGPLIDKQPAGRVGDLACPWIDYERASEYGEIIEVRPSKMQDPSYCYVLYLYKIRFSDGKIKSYKAGHCTVKAKNEQRKEN